MGKRYLRAKVFSSLVGIVFSLLFLSLEVANAYDSVVYKSDFDCSKKVPCNTVISGIKQSFIVKSNNPIVKNIDKAIDKAKVVFEWGDAEVSQDTLVTLLFLDPDNDVKPLGKWTFIVNPAPKSCEPIQDVKVGDKVAGCEALIGKDKTAYIVSDHPDIIKSGTQKDKFSIEWGDATVSDVTFVTLYFYSDEKHTTALGDQTFKVMPVKNNLKVTYSGGAIRGGDTSARFMIEGGTPPYTVVSDSPSVIDDVKGSFQEKYFTVKTETVTTSKDVVVYVKDSKQNEYKLPVKVTSSADPGYDTHHFYLTAGMVTLNQHKIKNVPDDKNKPHFIMQNSSVDIRPAFELVLRHRYAWEEIQRPKENDNKLANLFVNLDYEFRLGFASDSGNDATASVTAGGGDFFGEGSFGYNAVHPQKTDEGSVRFSVNAPELLYGFVTEKNFQKIHGYMGVGSAVIWGMPNPFLSQKNRVLEALTGIYYGWIDLPQVFLNNSGERELVQDMGTPKYTYKQALIVRGDIHIPVSETGYLTVDSRFYPWIFKSNTIQPWSVRLGVTYPIDSLWKNVYGFVTGAGH